MQIISSSPASGIHRVSENDIIWGKIRLKVTINAENRNFWRLRVKLSYIFSLLALDYAARARHTHGPPFKLLTTPTRLHPWVIGHRPSLTKFETKTARARNARG